jgi:hypothetical protein
MRCADEASRQLSFVILKKENLRMMTYALTYALTYAEVMRCADEASRHL